MANTNNNALLKNFSGSFADQFSIRTRGDKTIIAQLPKKGEKAASGIQAALKVKFKLAVLYAKKAILNAELKQQYAAAAQGNQTAFNVAFKDAYFGPELSDLRTDAYTGAPGQTIVVQAIDNFLIAAVKLSLYKPDGILIEEGELSADDNGRDWRYTTQQANDAVTGTIVRITAYDLPKNKAVLEAVL